MNQGSGGDISQSMKRANNKVRLGSVRVVATLLSSVLLFGAAIFGVAFKLVNDLATSVSSNPSAVQIVPPKASLASIPDLNLGKLLSTILILICEPSKDLGFSSPISCASTCGAAFESR